MWLQYQADQTRGSSAVFSSAPGSLLALGFMCSVTCTQKFILRQRQSIRISLQPAAGALSAGALLAPLAPLGRKAILKDLHRGMLKAGSGAHLAFT